VKPARPLSAAVLAALVLMLGATPARPDSGTRWTATTPDSAATGDPSAVDAEAGEEVLDEDLAEAPAAPAPAARKPAALEALVPGMAGGSYRMTPGPRPYRNRLAFSPGFGTLGNERLFVFRLAFNPNEWLGYEAALNHNPAQSVHAVHHSLSAIVRRPFPGRFQPYVAASYGMFMVFPGRSLNADPVTKNALSAGGGLEFFIRDDLALRGDLRRATVFGREKDREGVVAYDYLEQSIGLVFYRSITP
jgi:hypothetical protein